MSVREFEYSEMLGYGVLMLMDSDRKKQIARACEVFKGISHPVRLSIVILLSERDYTVSEIAEVLDARQGLVSQHLSPLRMLGLVSFNRSGGRSTYTLEEPMLRDLVKCLITH